LRSASHRHAAGGYAIYPQRPLYFFTAVYRYRYTIYFFHAHPPRTGTNWMEEEEEEEEERVMVKTPPSRSEALERQRRGELDGAAAARRGRRGGAPGGLGSDGRWPPDGSRSDAGPLFRNWLIIGGVLVQGQNVVRGGFVHSLCGTMGALSRSCLEIANYPISEQGPGSGLGYSAVGNGEHHPRTGQR
jgi:hypothetical protein